MILTIRTDKPLAEIGLYDATGKEIAYQAWEGHKQLSVTILRRIEDMLTEASIGYADLNGVVCYEGPGSFTGLRIGVSVVNGLQSGLGVTVVGSSGQDWIKMGMDRLSLGGQELVVPNYGAEPHITAQKK